MLPFGPLSQYWRAAAIQLRRYGAEPTAAALEGCAADLDDAVREYLYETLTLTQAADLAGVSYDTMSRKLRSGEVPNAGRRNKPLVQRRYVLLGMKALGPRPMTDNGEPDIAAEALNARA